MVHQVAYALDRQIDKVAAASSLGMIGMASIFGRFFFGWLCDRIRDAKYAAALGFFLMAGGMFLLMQTTTVTTLFLYALLFGFGYGSISALMPFLLADRFGRHILGASYGMMVFFVMAIGGSTGPMITGYIYDLTGSYTDAWLLNLAVLVIVTFLILTLKKPGKMSATVTHPDSAPLERQRKLQVVLFEERPVREDLRGGPVRDHRPLPDHDAALADVEDQVEVVGGDDLGVA